LPKIFREKNGAFEGNQLLVLVKAPYYITTLFGYISFAIFDLALILEQIEEV
jgi:hypothetical protein